MTLTCNCSELFDLHSCVFLLQYCCNIVARKRGISGLFFFTIRTQKGKYDARRLYRERIYRMKMEKPILQVRDLGKIYRMGDERVIALNRVNLEICPGEICCIFGTSGSGKSTFLNLLAGMEKPTCGSIKIMGKEITKMTEKELAGFRQQNLGFIFQSYNLLPGATALENVAMPLMFRGMSRKQRERIAMVLLKRVGLENRADHYPGQMSGGQQQRVGIARSFVAKPRIIFADEPTGNLDTRTTAEVMQMITGCAMEFQQTIILVTHDPEMAKYATRIIHMVDGKIIEDRKAAAENSSKVSA